MKVNASMWLKIVHEHLDNGVPMTLLAKKYKVDLATSTTYEYEYPDWGTWTFVYKTVTEIQGVFYIGVDSLKTIDISSATNIDTSVLIGRLDNVSIQN